jgi:Kef-type K+ transport system membrane component KefB/mannitol/fructose-specific phosphotransferase system IIA component
LFRHDSSQEERGKLMTHPGSDYVLLSQADPLLCLAVILLAGVLAGKAAKGIGVPRVTGQILVGILLGPSVFSVFHHEPLEKLAPITSFALALMTMTVGSHLNMRRLRNAGKRLIALLFLEMTLTPLLVALVLHFGMGVSIPMSLMLGVLAISTAPATIVALVKETRSKGLFVKTLLAGVALNNIACIFLFEVAHGLTRVYFRQDVGQTIMGIHLEAGVALLQAMVLGGMGGYLLIRFTRGGVKNEVKTTMSLLALLWTAGWAAYFGGSPLLACLFLGVTLVNLAPDHEGIGDRVFVSFEEAILCVFFTMAGMELNFAYLDQAGTLAFAVVILRFAGKLLSGWFAMWWAGSPDGLRKFLGMALVPQAGVAIGLLLITVGDPAMRPIADLLLATGVTMVAINEIIGPLLTRQALRWSGDAGQDRARLIDFLHEENILVNLQASTKKDAVEQLVEIVIRTHSLQNHREEILASVLKREGEASTCLGQGLAVPHGELPAVKSMVGAMGISRQGLPFDSADGQPVHCMVLLLTPPADHDRHVEVLAALARVVSKEEQRLTLFHAISPGHAYVILQDEEFEEYNYFLEEMDHF